jgi:hypothetical protein
VLFNSRPAPMRINTKVHSLHCGMDTEAVTGHENLQRQRCHSRFGEDRRSWRDCPNRARVWTLGITDACDPHTFVIVSVRGYSCEPMHFLLRLDFWDLVLCKGKPSRANVFEPVCIHGLGGLCLSIWEAEIVALRWGASGSNLRAVS